VGFSGSFNSPYMDGLDKARRYKSRWRKEDWRKINSHGSSPMENQNQNQTNSGPVIMNATFLFPFLAGLKNQNNPYESPTKAPRGEKSSSSGNFYLQDISKFNFSTIGGYTSIKNELIQVMDMIERPENYSIYNVRLPKGILLFGPPGNGKTLLARCFAGEFHLPIIATSGSEFQEKYVGTGPARIRELFEFARENSPCMVFIDEIDAVARKRGSDGDTAQAERDSTLNQLLVELDGFDSFLDDKIFVMASTNRIDILDPALLRPGRIDKKIQVPIPDRETRREIIKIHSQLKPVNCTLEWMMELTEGQSGAEIEHLLNEAVLSGIRQGSLPVTEDDLEKVREISILGQNAHEQILLSDEMSKRISIHELGHALIAILATNHENPKKCSILGNQRMLGYTLFPPRNSSSLMTMEDMKDQIKVLLGGRAAEEIIFGTEGVTSGASDDLEKCMRLAHDMVLTYGMGSKIVYPRLSDTSKQEIDDAVSSLINETYTKVKIQLLLHKNLLLHLSGLLMINKTLELEDILRALKHFKNLAI